MAKNIIIYAGGFILPDGNAAAHRVLNNAKIFRDLGYKVIFLGISHSSSTNINLKTNSTPKIVQGFHVYEIGYPQNFIQWVKYLFSINKTKDLIDIYKIEQIHSLILYNFPSPSLFKLIKLGKQKNIKIIADITEWYGGSGKNILLKSLKRIDNVLRIKVLQFSCNGIICISKFLNNYYKNQSTVLIPPLVDKNEEKWIIDFPELNTIKEFTYAGSPGSSNEKESFKELLNIFVEISKNHKFLLNIIGVTSEEIIRKNPHLEKIVTRLSGKLNFLGKLSNTKCIEVINKSHFFIFLRYNSIVTSAGFPTKFVESIASGTPVLTNKTSNIEDYLIEGKTGFWIENHNPAQMKSVLLKCIEMDNKQISLLKTNCLKYDKFSYNKFLIPMNNFISNLK